MSLMDIYFTILIGKSFILSIRIYSVIFLESENPFIDTNLGSSNKSHKKEI